MKSRSNNNASVAATKETNNNNNNKKEKKEKKPLGEVAKNLFVALNLFVCKTTRLKRHLN